MVNLYTDADYDNALKLKKRLLAIYFAVLTVFVAAFAVVFVLFLQLPYQSTQEIIDKKNLYLFINCALSVFLFIFSVIYLSIPYKRAKWYFRFLDDTKTGDKQINVSTFVKNEDDITEVGNVDFRVMVVLEWSDKTQEYMRRHVLVDKEKPMPQFKNGDIIKYVTHANCLLSYGLKSEDDVFEEIKS